MVTKKIAAAKVLSYLHHKITLEELVLWAENALMSGNYEKESTPSLRNILAMLGVADVKSFGLDWNTCESIMGDLGYKLKVKAQEVA